ncbi:hypothetical protein [Oecophyllibacter saccharovorans]|uniref:Uncharacterized protein n=1 Tax=Oecophyllibacter saccharovorans TaxID=2558360 RepID=A0A506UQ71_9PROT|nr:hypothetical protein [Oecophyllibacter saccharovorans]TPW35464.1 hypothetical protein E3202_00265 [Oecophyllibacter saccharovorans]
MDLSKLEQAYTQYAGVAQQAFQLLENLISKMQEAAQNGDEKAGHWAAELQQVVQTLEGGQTHIGTLLQQFHGALSAFEGNSSAAASTTAAGSEAGAAGTAASGTSSHGLGGLVSDFLNSDIGKSIEQGALGKLGKMFKS